ncbi:MAG: ubiquitin-like domain-containing protein [Armatimonadota bacterium]|nr:ubiquitin-like domain-containing protein [Armatimonadota bacterium]
MEVARVRRARAVSLATAAFVLATLSGAGAQPAQPVQVELVDDGRAESVLTTSRTVAELLAERGVSVGSFDLVVPSLETPVRDGLRVTVFRAIPVRVTSDGVTREVPVVGRTVADVLARAGITLGPLDRVVPGLWEEVGPGREVRVVRVRQETVVRRQVVPYGTVERIVPAYLPEPPRVLVEGRNGVVEHTYRLTYEDGRLVHKEKVATRVVQQSRPRVVRVGRTYVPSRGELARRPSLLVLATAYAPNHGRGVDAVTATGLRARRGVVAVDPRVIPLGSVVYVEGYGVGVAADTGGAIRGRRVDVCFDTPREAYRWGRRVVRVYLLRTPSEDR